MTYMAVCIDGNKTMTVTFGDQDEFLRWRAIIDEIKDAAAGIIAKCPDPEYQTETNVHAMHSWLTHVDAMMEAGTPVLPSILSARDDFMEVIADQ
eukprot:scaffold69613_cov58-Attheya_sp.AAC.2